MMYVIYSVTHIRVFIDTDLPVDFTNQDINIISEALKCFLRQLPDPLIPFSLYNKFIEAGSEHLHIMCR